MISDIFLNGFDPSIQVSEQTFKRNDQDLIEIILKQENKELYSTLIKCSKLYNLIPADKRPNKIDALSMMEYLDKEQQEIILFNIDLLNKLTDFEEVLIQLYETEKEYIPNPIKDKMKVSTEKQNTLLVSNKFMKELKKSLSEF